MESQARGVEATPLLRKRDDKQGWFAGVGLFTTRRDDASGASRGARAVLALGAAAMLCVGAASTSAGQGVLSSLGASSSAAAGNSVFTSLGRSPGVAVGKLGDDPAFKHAENIVKYPTPLPDVDFSGKTLLIVMGHPFSGTSALEGLIGTGSGVTDLCKSGTWQCEDTWLLKYMDFNMEPGVDEWNEYYPVDAAGYAYAFQHFALTWWNMSKPVLMDKTPNLIARHRVIADAAKMLGVPVKFVLLSRHPFSWTSRTHPFDEKRWLKLMKFNRAVLDDDTIDVLHVRYEDLAWRMRETVASVEAFAPELGALDPWRSALAFEEKDHNSIQGSRAMPVAEYFKENPLEWKQNWTLSAETFQTLCAVGYTEHGECKEWRRRALPGFETADASDSEEEVALEEISFPEMRRASGAAGGEGPTQRETRPGTATDTPPNAADTARAARAARRRKNRRANPKSPP